MKTRNLVILDLKNNLDIDENNCNYISLSSGLINFKNSKHIFIKKYLNKYYKEYKRKLILSLMNKMKSNTTNFLEECEVFNVRNDKELFYNKLIVILIINKFILKKYKSVKIITDDFFTYKVFIKLNFKVSYYGNIKKKYDFSGLKIFKFYLKTLIILILEKLTKKKKLNDDYENLYFSMYPNFYNKGKESFFKKDKDLKINFLLTDETHLNLKLADIQNILKNFKQKNTVNLESFIFFSDIFKLILILPINIFNSFFKSERNFIIENCDFTDFFNHYMNISLVNRFKLEIYKKSFIRFQKKFSKIKNFHYYMFEYSFGFFVTNFFKKNFKDITLHGYQHGIFSDNIMWLDLIKHNLNYLPHKIVALNEVCAKDYKYVTKKKAIYLNQRNKKLSFALRLKKNKNKEKKNRILIFTGTHDARDIYNLVLNTKKRRKNDVYYFKFHPKAKIDFTQNKYMRKVEKINGKTFSKVLISQTSTLIYDFIKTNQKFNSISYDFRPSLTSSKLKKRYEITL